MHTTIEIANAVLTKMQALVSGEVLSYLESVLMSELRDIELEVNALSNVEDEASKYMERFLAAKTIEDARLRPSVLQGHTYKGAQSNQKTNCPD